MLSKTEKQKIKKYFVNQPVELVYCNGSKANLRKGVAEWRCLAGRNLQPLRWGNLHYLRRHTLQSLAKIAEKRLGADESRS